MVTLFRKTKGRAKQQLENRVKKFHVFEGHLKVESQVKKLETEIEEWERKYKNLEKEKEELFNEMTQIIHKRMWLLANFRK